MCIRDSFCAAALSYRLQKLFGAEDTVSAVTQTRNDVLVVVELFIQSSTVNLYVRMCSVSYTHLDVYKRQQEMRQLGMTKFCGETRASNHAMQWLFTRCGYRLEWMEENYYQHPDESAYKYILQ